MSDNKMNTLELPPMTRTSSTEKMIPKIQNDLEENNPNHTIPMNLKNENDKNDTEKEEFICPDRCVECKKKLGLVVIKCRCGFPFCGKHIRSDKHQCTYDWKGQTKLDLNAHLPKINADKIRKI
jgi:AN1-type zinc finger protein 5/6